MIICNHLITQICLFLDIKTMCALLLYLPISNENKNQIVQSYCLLNKKCNNLQIVNYYDTLLYFQNKHSYKCYKCQKQLHLKYYLVICNCVTDSFHPDYIVYTKYHLECIPVTNKKYNKELYIMNCQFCKKTRIGFRCNIYS